MKVAVIVGFLSTSLISSSESTAQKTHVEDPYSAGCSCFEQLDFACAIELLTVAARQTDKEDIPRLIDIHRKLAESQLALGRRREAIDTFEALLDIKPGYRIESPGVSPKILDALSKARENTKKERPPLPSPEPSPPAWLEVGLAAGAELLVGNDRELLGTGPAFELECNFIPSAPWRVGLGLRYTFHEVSASSEMVHVFGAWAAFGVAFEIDSFYLSGLVGLGTQHFGIPGEESKTGLLIPVRLSASFQLSGTSRMGLLVEPGWLLTFDSGTKSSFTTTIGIRLAMAF